MKPLRSLLMLCLVMVTITLTACGGDVVKAPPTYTPEKIAAIERAIAPIEAVHDRMPELGNYVAAKDWNNIKSFLHGPLGGLRSTLGYLDRSLLLKKDQGEATARAEALFADIEQLDSAASEQVGNIAQEVYGKTVADFDAYLEFIPHTPDA
ncbi:photosystem II protein PsbQ [Spirulina sp. CCNP1310]|uniref:photosystem II protein PsbQ n=1 Tax=Spirulina sp. CCNP1310 TaxID=3110249 RepID=UPI002B213D22|nr:photosystem II protein PsbQ [Spirulina sp. CCNP1310]MEA5418814.1 photosystem II protein PsbQ [Spirulina sp. CCNP1310]